MILIEPRFETLLIQYKPKEIVIERGSLSQCTIQMLKRVVDNKDLWNILIPEKEFLGREKTELKVQNYFGDSKSQENEKENEDIEINTEINCAETVAAEFEKNSKIKEAELTTYVNI